MHFCKIENFTYGEINERSFSNPHPGAAINPNIIPSKLGRIYISVINGILIQGPYYFVLFQQLHGVISSLVSFSRLQQNIAMDLMIRAVHRLGPFSMYDKLQYDRNITQYTELLYISITQTWLSQYDSCSNKIFWFLNHYIVSTLLYRWHTHKHMLDKEKIYNISIFFLSKHHL